MPPLVGLFNCAGFVQNGTVLDTSGDDWAFSVDLNVTSMMRMCSAFLPGLRGRIGQSDDSVQAEKDFIARQPIGRLATVGDITRLVVYPLSDASRYVTGQSMLVDGGVTI